MQVKYLLKLTTFNNNFGFFHEQCSPCQIRQAILKEPLPLNGKGTSSADRKNCLLRNSCA